MPGLELGIHGHKLRAKRPWIAGSSPAMTSALGLEVAGEELRSAEPEGPVLVAVLDDRDHHVGGRDAARFFEFLAHQLVERLLLLLGARSAHHLNDHDLVGAVDAETGVLD